MSRARWGSQSWLPPAFQPALGLGTERLHLVHGVLRPPGLYLDRELRAIAVAHSDVEDIPSALATDGPVFTRSTAGVAAGAGARLPNGYRVFATEAGARPQTAIRASCTSRAFTSTRQGRCRYP